MILGRQGERYLLAVYSQALMANGHVKRLSPELRQDRVCKTGDVGFEVWIPAETGQEYVSRHCRDSDATRTWPTDVELDHIRRAVCIEKSEADTCAAEYGTEHYHVVSTDGLWLVCSRN